MTTHKSSEGEEELGVESSERALIDPSTLDPGAKENPNQRRLANAKQCFVAGDYQSVRQLVDGLTDSSDPQIAREARDLKRRVAVDLVQIAVIVLCSAVFLAIVIIYILR